MDEPFIMLSTGLVELMSRDSLRFVLGHEVGHVPVRPRGVPHDHAAADQPADVLVLDAGERARHPRDHRALREWYRKAELSCDRAGLLCGQDPTRGVAGADPSSRRDRPGADRHPSFLQQAAEYESVEDIRDSFLKLRSVETQTHPFAVVRAAQLQKWAATEEYRAILAGDYIRRDGESPTSD